jgi:NADH dehydrogenase [ubiquinone] 1 alpha subcomplex assembly factor 1
MVQTIWLALLGSALLMTTISMDMNQAAWRAINDGVMGGISTSAMTSFEEGLRFSGDLSLENNGGFASTRRLVNADLSAADRVRLVVRGDGRQYQFRIRHDRSFDGIAWRVEFLTEDEWQTLEIPLADFVPVFRGRTVRDAGPVVPPRITQIGFMLADKNPGPFRLEIHSIEFLPTAEHGK